MSQIEPTLPKTFEPTAVESSHYERWEKTGAFAAHPETKAAPFTIMMPPPNVTGSLHMGHALTMTLQDVLTRINRMKGKDALWMPGTDHAGIATQMVVERQLEAQGQSRQKMGRDAFLEKVWAWKAESGGTITKQLRKLGTTPDWARERFTMDEGLSTAVIKVFVELYKQGLIYRDKRLVNWDPKMLTAISDLEVEQKETKTHMWHIAYHVEGDTERTITVATTRPETMLGDTAIAVHPDDERYQDLIGKFAVVPIVGRLVPIVADTYADPESGSGAVKITPAHDFNDFELGKRHGLPMIPVMDIHARICGDVPDEYVGLDRYDARKKILAELEHLDVLVKVDDYTTMLPYSQRSGVVVEPFLSDQWYCDAPTLAKPALEAVKTGKTKFVPQQWENTYYQWMENIQPWCISRQLWWGHQIPAWYGPDGKVFVELNEETALATARLHYGKDVKLTRDPDVLDTWFSSALWPFSTLGWPEKTPELAKYYPGDVLITGFDIIFFWVARMMMMGMHFMGDVPFKTVYIHALVRDAKGQKMSKTKGNVIDPLDLTGKYGADAVRFTLAALTTPGRDVRLAEKSVEGYRNFATKLWNASRYAEMQGCPFGAAFDPASVTHPVNKWVIAKTRECERGVSADMEAYRYDLAAKRLYDFVWGTVCDWYVEAAKVVDLPESKATTAWVLDQIFLLLNPFMPFITQELFDKLHGTQDKLLLTSAWPTYDFANDTGAVAQMDAIQNLIVEIRSVRAAMNVPPAAEVPLIVLESTPESKAATEALMPVLKRLARLSSISFAADAPKGSVRSVASGVSFALPVADLIDLAKEKARLTKEVGKLQSDLEKIEAKLANDDFVSKAPEDILEEQRQRAQDTKTTLTRLSSALAALAA